MLERDPTPLVKNLDIIGPGEWSTSKKKKFLSTYRRVESEEKGLSEPQKEPKENLEVLKMMDDDFKHSDCLQLPTRIGDFYATHKIGEGSFARVYIGRPIDDARCVAVKIRKNWERKEDESSDDEEEPDSEEEEEVRNPGGNDQLTTSSEEEPEQYDFQMEVEVLRSIHRNGVEEHFPELFHYDPSPNLHYIAMTLFGESLRELKLETPNRCLEWGTIARIGIQTLYAMKVCHESGFLHRDVKPANLMMGSPNDSRRRRIVHLIDFGLAKRWAAQILDEDDGDNEQKEHQNEPDPAEPIPIEELWVATPLRRSTKFRGSLRYASPNMHRRTEQGRVDDIWSLIFTLVDLGGHVPWAGELDEKSVIKMKDDVLGWLKGKPKQLKRVVEHLLGLKTLQRPNYHLIFNAFHSIMSEAGETPHSPYTWEEMPPTGRSKTVTKSEWEDPKGTFFTIDYLGINGPKDIMHDYRKRSILSRRAQTERLQIHPGTLQIDLQKASTLSAEFLQWKRRTLDVNRRLCPIGRTDYDVIDVEGVLDLDVNAMDEYKGDFDLEKAASSEKYGGKLDFGWMKVREDEVGKKRTK